LTDAAQAIAKAKSISKGSASGANEPSVLITEGLVNLAKGMDLHGQARQARNEAQLLRADVVALTNTIAGLTGEQKAIDGNELDKHLSDLRKDEGERKSAVDKLRSELGSLKSKIKEMEGELASLNDTAEEARIKLGKDEDNWEFTLKADRFCFQSLKLPVMTDKLDDQEDRDGAILERMYLIETATKTMISLFRLFLDLRLSPRWLSTEAPRIKNWLQQ
jgi:chromosome segregation ATPase